MPTSAFITGVSGLVLTAEEQAFLRARRPWGFILFKRNVDTPAQVAALVAQLRDCIGNPGAPVLIDQEGGRVQRLGPPHWPAYPAGVRFAELYGQDPATGLRAAWLANRVASPVRPNCDKARPAAVTSSMSTWLASTRSQVRPAVASALANALWCAAAVNA